MQAFDEAHCPSCGQLISEAMDPDLADEWDTFPPMRDHACTAIARAAKQYETHEHPGALRYVAGLRDGWQERKAALVAARAERAASGKPRDEPE